MRYFFDLDGTLCNEFCGGYENAEPYKKRIKIVNQLYDAGHHITIYTARGATTGLNHRKLTKKQLKKWGLKYHELDMNKPYWDVLIDNRCLTSEQFFNKLWY